MSQLGVIGIFRGLRRGDTPMLIGGMLLSFIGWRRNRKKKRKRVQRVTIKPGQARALRVTSKGRDPIEFDI